jgi:hypothetical protein
MNKATKRFALWLGGLALLITSGMLVGIWDRWFRTLVMIAVFVVAIKAQRSFRVR